MSNDIPKKVDSSSLKIGPVGPTDSTHRSKMMDIALGRNALPQIPSNNLLNGVMHSAMEFSREKARRERRMQDNIEALAQAQKETKAIDVNIASQSAPIKVEDVASPLKKLLNGFYGGVGISVGRMVGTHLVFLALGAIGMIFAWWALHASS